MDFITPVPFITIDKKLGIEKLPSFSYSYQPYFIVVVNTTLLPIKKHIGSFNSLDI